MDKTSFAKNKKLILISVIILVTVVSSAYGIMKIRSKVASQQKQLDELNAFKSEQLRNEATAKAEALAKQAEDTAQQEAQKKTDCQNNLARLTGFLANKQHDITVETAQLKSVEAGNLYKDCLKRYQCDSASACGSNEVNNCKRNNQSELTDRKNNLKKDNQALDDLIKEIEAAKNDCKNYL